MVKILVQLWSTIYAWVILPSDRKPRAIFLKILAMSAGNCQSHHVFIMGRDPNWNRNKKNRQKPYGTLSVCCQEIVFCFKSQRHPRCIEENNPLYIQWCIWLNGIDWKDGMMFVFKKLFNVLFVNWMIWNEFFNHRIFFIFG